MDRRNGLGSYRKAFHLVRNPMGYVDRILQAGEVVRSTGTLHWIIFARGAAMALICVGLIIAAETSRKKPPGHWSGSP
jgi:hypothetical protein